MTQELNRKMIRDEIRTLLETIGEQFETIRGYEGRIPQIEFDIIMDNIRKLYEDMSLLHRMDDPLFSRSKAEVPANDRPAAAFKEPAIAAGPPPEEDSKEKRTEPRPLSGPDLFTGTGSDFGEKLKEVREKTMGPALSRKRPDLKSIISINEKFLFINDLFDGNLKEYNEALNAVMACGDKSSALEEVDRLRITNRWDSEKPAFKKLTEMVRRLYS